jgi:glyoxylase-like metal-dependent hydrolase (beta-lactamase superfamily II)
MSLRIITVLTGFAHTFIVKQNDKAFIIDTGTKGNEGKILKAMQVNKIAIEDLKFIFITHAHYDHAGSASALHKITSAPILIHQSEASFLTKGYQPLPKGTTSFYKSLIYAGSLMGRTFSGFPPVTPNITFTVDMELFNRFDIPGKIIHTPGHTVGSSSLLVEKNLFAGDTIFNIWNGVIYPIFADDETVLKKTWGKLLKLDIDNIYPAHGKRIDMMTFKKAALKKGVV